MAGPMTQSETVTIAADRTEVFERITKWGMPEKGMDDSRMKMTDAEILDGEVHKNAKVRYCMEGFGRTMHQTIGYEVAPPAKVTYTVLEMSMMESMAGNMKGEFLLEDLGNTTTRCTHSVEVEFGMPMPKMMKRRMLRMMVEKSLEGLKDSFEILEDEMSEAVGGDDE